MNVKPPNEPSTILLGLADHIRKIQFERSSQCMAKHQSWMPLFPFYHGYAGSTHAGLLGQTLLRPTSIGARFFQLGDHLSREFFRLANQPLTCSGRFDGTSSLVCRNSLGPASIRVAIFNFFHGRLDHCSQIHPKRQAIAQQRFDGGILLRHFDKQNRSPIESRFLG